MPAFFVDYNLMPFHLSLFAVILLGVVETLGYLFKIRPTKFLKQISLSTSAISTCLMLNFRKF